MCSAETRCLRRDVLKFMLKFELVSEDEVGDGGLVADVDRAMLN